jgi:cytochrome b involved in lipid metabolism
MITAFLIYRMIRLVGDYTSATMSTKETMVKPTFVTHTLTKSIKNVASASDGYVWQIYGNTYDLTDYVRHHPGGKEAIMLGEGRDDCTAIFQSYHAFNIGKAKAVLEKYRISPMAIGQTKETLTSNKHENDLFYDELSKRVAAKLRSDGIDPVKNRAGTWTRWLYYSWVLASLLIGCYYHCKVCFN